MAHVNEFPSNESTSSFQKYSKENRQQRIPKLADCRIYAGSHVRRQLSPRKKNSWRFSDDEGWELDAQTRFWDGHTALNCLREASPETKIVVCEPDNAPLLYSGTKTEYDAAGRFVEPHPVWRRFDRNGRVCASTLLVPLLITQ